ncbi:hypothetical protein O181_086441 [Austropuccinia psidii MF-1]|uniref:Integrase catalytic domain-containing protein n=1 Tax=Austropuccinia psidii MF-1 TaxID=1389203 RepID=A0A9Q3G008_9BASI|nr:hypothetical protein [Austropuccinia psidii MF-1]
MLQMSKSKQSHRKEFGMMIQIQEQKYSWEIVHMYWVTALPPGGDRSYNACIVLVERYSKTPMFLPCHKDNSSMDTAITIWNKAFSHTGLFQNIISDKRAKINFSIMDKPPSLVWNKVIILNSLPPSN